MYVFVCISCLGFGVSGWVRLPGHRVSRQGAQQEALLLDNLDDILMFHGVGQAHPLWAVLGAGALGEEQRGHISLCKEQGQAWYSYYRKKVGRCRNARD